MRRVLVIFICLLSYFSYGQRPVVYDKPMVEDPQIIFERLTSEDGLSHDRVTDIIQDSHGFIWIATVDGLNRYDGKQFEIYRHNDDNYTSISSSFISCIAESESGDVYIGTKKGLNKYDRLTNSFILIELDIMNKYAPVRQLMFDNDSILWIETIDGYLINFNIKQRLIFSSYKHTTVNQTFYLYHDIYRDKQGVLWIGTRNVDPMYLDEKTDKITYIKYDINDYTKKRARDMACYYEDSYDNFWFTALDGIYLFDRDTEVFNKFLGTTTYDVVEDSLGNIWFATGSGVMKYNPKANEITLMKNEKDNPNSISNNNVHKVMEDDMGNLWFATSLGVNIYSPPAYPFKHFTHIPGISNSPEGYVVTAVAEDNKNNLWIGYNKDGLDYYDKKSGIFHHNLANNNIKNSISSNRVSSLYFDDKKLLWIGLWSGIGFNILDTKSNEFYKYTFDSASFERDWYNGFIEDNNGNYYIGFWGANGLTGFDEVTRQFKESYKTRFGRVFCSRLITKMVRGKDGSIWFGTTDCGIHRYFPEADSGVSYFSDTDNPRGLSSNQIVDITVDNNGIIWFINDKLQCYHPENDSFLSFGYKDGLTTSELASVVSDDDGGIWVGSKTDGLYEFSQHNLKFTHFVKHDGLFSNSFTDATAKLNNGEIFMGSNNGFNIFRPSEIVDDNIIPTPYFGRLYIFDHIVSHDLNDEEIVILEPDANVFTIELLSSDIVNHGRYSYQCMLKGYDDDWVEVDNSQSMVRYAAVPPGRYNLKYRIGNRKGLWSEKTCEMEFVVEKPYYLSWWFISSIIFALSILLYLFVKKREFDLKQKNRNIELQQRLFRLQMNPHFMFNSLLAIQNFIFQNNAEVAGNYLADFARLFRLIFNNSKSEFIQIGRELETLNLYLKLQSLRYPDKFTYCIYLDPEIDVDLIMIPPMLAQPMIENSLEHGLFYKEGLGNINISFTYKGKQLLFEIEDNGVGLTKSKEKQTIKTDHKSSALDITRERVKILAKRHKYYAFFDLVELKGSDGNVIGTKVSFNLPTKISLFDKFE